uniref:Tubulin polyglutamylase complex subunit 2 n=1 Tax=Cyprinus carpio TaxID=7962 RepID=A0A8C1XHF6_CYPCA
MEVKDYKTCKGFVDRITLGITRVLGEAHPGVLDVRFVEKPPAEKKNNCALPEDLRDFYLTTDGFMLAWNTKLEMVPVGCMMIRSVVQLRPLIQSNVYSLPNAPTLSLFCFQPNFDSCSRIFELDPCNGNGKVCLVYKNCLMAQQCEVWFLDRSLFWHYLSPSFTAYYRLMITHLGLRSGSIISLRMAPAHKLRSALSIQIYLNRRFE